jgi:hypothetical protein
MMQKSKLMSMWRPSLHALGVADLRRRRRSSSTNRNVSSPVESDWDRDVPPHPINSAEVLRLYAQEHRAWGISSRR